MDKELPKIDLLSNEAWAAYQDGKLVVDNDTVAILDRLPVRFDGPSPTRWPFIFSPYWCQHNDDHVYFLRLREPTPHWPREWVAIICDPQTFDDSFAPDAPNSELAEELLGRPVGDYIEEVMDRPHALYVNDTRGVK